MVSQAYTISTVKNSVPPKVKMSQYDSASRTITFTVVDASGTAVSLTGKTATVEGTRIDGHAFAANCTVSGNTVSFVETVDMTNAAGDHPAELVIRENGQRLGTMNFVIAVEAAAMDENASITPEDESLFNQLYGSVDDAIAEVDGAKDDALLEIAQGLASGAPLTANTVAAMTDTDAVYLYTGSESGYTAGSWYYYNGSSWVVGGVYGAGTTDATLTLAGVAADAKATGDAVGKVEQNVMSIMRTEETNLLSGAKWEVGSLNVNDGSNLAATNRIRTVKYIDLRGVNTLSFTIAQGYKFVIDWYDENHVANKAVPFGVWNTADLTILVPNGVAYMRMLVSNTANGMASVDFAQHLTCVANYALINTLDTLQSDLDANAELAEAAIVLSGVQTVTYQNDYVSGSHTIPTGSRYFLGTPIPENSMLRNVSVFVGTSSATAYVVCEVWELDETETTLTRIYESRVNAPSANSWVDFPVEHLSTKKMLVSFHKSGCYVYVESLPAASDGVYYTTDITSTALNINNLSRQLTQELICGVTYLIGNENKTQDANLLNLDYYNGDAVNKREIGTIDSTKTVLVFGDSITAGSGDTSWTSHFATMTGCTIINKAVAGATYGESTSSLWISTQINEVTETQWGNADIIIVSAGTNDGVHNTPDSEIRDKVQNAIDLIRTHTSSPIIFITPTRRNTPAYSENLKLPYIGGIISNVAVSNQCNVVCGFNFPLSPQTLGVITNLTRDGLHPNAIGANVYARALIGRIL